MKVQRLIEKYKKLEGVWDAEGAEIARRIFLQDLEQLDEPKQPTLDNIIHRIKFMEEDLKQEWLSKILKELGSDFEFKKFQEGFKSGSWIGRQLINADKIRQELNKPVIPQFVADWIEVCKEHLTHSLYTAMTPNFMKENGQSLDLILWIKKASNQDIFARAWLDGYDVEKEKRYTVKIKANLGQYLERYYLNNEELTPQFKRTKPTGSDELPTFTRKELEEAGFGWVFDCEGIEVEEVE